MCTSNTAKEARNKRKEKSCKILKGIASNMFKYAFLLFRHWLDLVIDFVFNLVWEGEKKPLPPLEAKHRMLTESAVALAQKIRAKQLKSEDLVRACIERIKSVNPLLNAVTDERYEDALKDAREVDRMIAAGLSEDYFRQKPFLGVPFTAKESHAVAGMVHSLGILSRRHLRAPEDAECVRLLRAAGGIPVAVTNVPEINKWQETRNMLFGQTSNPYHQGRTVGGSSGGEAALAAAIASPISLCSDIGGSTRMPGFYCGLFALNPTAGYTSLKGSTLRSGEHPTMASIGFVSRHITDLAPLTRVVMGDQAGQIDLDTRFNIQDIDFFYMETAHDLRVSPVYKDLRSAMTNVIKKLSAAAPSTERAPKPYYQRGFNHMYSLWRHAMTKEADSFPRLLANNQGEANGLAELAKKVVGQSEFTLAAILKLLDEQVLPPVDARWAEPLLAELREDLLRTLGARGVLLAPSCPRAAPPHYSPLLRPYNFAYWGVFNVLHFPAAQVPLGLNSEGLPLGIQVVAAPRQEALCLSVAEYLAKEFGGFVPPCPVL